MTQFYSTTNPPAMLLISKKWSTPTLWLDANDSSTYTLEDTTYVTSWRNKQNPAHDFTAATTKRPQLATGVLNGMPGMQFDGSSDYLAYNAGLFTGSAGTFIGVVSFLGSGADHCVIFSQSDSDQGTVYAYIRRLSAATGSKPSAYGRYATAAVSSTGQTALSDSTGYIITLTTTGDGDALFRINGLRIYTTQVAADGLTGFQWFGDLPVNPDRTIVGSYVNSSYTNGTDFMNGYVCEIMCWDGIVLNDTYLRNAEKYLANRYGITLI